MDGFDLLFNTILLLIILNPLELGYQNFAQSPSALQEWRRIRSENALGQKTSPYDVGVFVAWALRKTASNPLEHVRSAEAQGAFPFRKPASKLRIQFGEKRQQKQK